MSLYDSALTLSFADFKNIMRTYLFESGFDIQYMPLLTPFYLSLFNYLLVFYVF